MQPLSSSSLPPRTGWLFPAVLVVLVTLLVLSLATALPVSLPVTSSRSPDLSNDLTLANIAMLATGSQATCAITTARQLNCWNAATGMQPTAVEGLSGEPLQVTVGGGFTCALMRVAPTATEVACWGSALGDGLASTTPTTVAGLAGNITYINAGLSHACAVVDHAVRCWGSNWYGELGAGLVGQPQSAALAATLHQPVHKVAAGYRHTCALLGDGSVQCWGHGSAGQLGTGDTPLTSPTPLPVQGLAAKVVDLSAGGEHTCALLADGRVQCWGANWWGQLGNGAAAARDLPVFASVTDAIALSAGGGHTCALTRSGAVYCWGDNAVGQLGDGHDADQLLPQPVPGLSNDVTAIYTGPTQTCITLHDGAAHCWGLALP